MVTLIPNLHSVAVMGKERKRSLTLDDRLSICTDPKNSQSESNSVTYGVGNQYK